MRSRRIFKFAMLFVLLADIVCVWQGCDIEEIFPTGPYKLTGYVKDSKTGVGIPNAWVQVQAFGVKAVRTDSAGFYGIDNIPSGVFDVTASKTGFTTVSKQVVIEQLEESEECEDCTYYYFAGFHLTRISEYRLIGPAGGKIDLDDDTKIVIPPGALSAKTLISATSIPAIGMVSPALSKNLRALIGLDLRPDGLIFHTPITITFSVADWPFVVGGVNIWLYSFDPIRRDWIDPIEVQFNDTRTQATIQVTHFSVFGILAVPWLQAIPGAWTWSPGKDLATGPCGEGVSAPFNPQPTISDPLIGGVTLEDALDEISAIEPVSATGSCSPTPGYKKTLRVRCKMRHYLIQKYNFTFFDWEYVGEILVPMWPIQFRCVSVRCHPQGVGQ